MKKDTYKQFFNSIPLSCLVLKPESSEHFTIVDVNTAYLDITGSGRKDIIGKLSCEVFPKNPESQNLGHDIFYASLQKVRNTAKRDKIEVVRFDIPIRGTNRFQKKYWRPENIPVLNEKGEVDYILHVVQEVTEQVNSEKNKKKVQEELIINRQQYRHFIENNLDGLYSLDVNGKFTSVNEGLAQIAETPVEELLQMDFLPFCAPHDKEKISVHFIKAIAGEANKFEADFISAKGREMVLEISLMPIKLNGEVIGTYGIAKNLSGIRQTEKILFEKGKYLEINASFISSLLGNDFEGQVLEEAFAAIGKTVRVDRMYYFETYTNEKSREIVISQKIEWCSGNATVQLNNPEMQDLPIKKLEKMMGSLTRNVPFTANLSELEENELKNIFLDQDIKSMLLLPIFVKNNLNGFIGFDDCTRERKWSDDEITFLRSLAHNLSTAFEKRTVEVALKQQEEQLVRSERKFKALVQEGSDLMGIMDLEGNYKFVSETTTAILGLKPEEFIGKNAFDFIHPEDKDRVQEQYESLKTSKQVKIKPFRFVDKQGNWRWLETTLTNLMKDPAVAGVVYNTRDITNYRAQALEIERINERYRLAAMATKDLIYDWNLENDKVIRFREDLKELFGYPPEEVDKREFWPEHIHPEDVDILRRKLKEALSDPKINFIKTEYRFKRADGSYAKVIDKGYIIRDKQGKAIRLVGATTDISEIAAKEEALKTANKRFKRAMKATNEMIWDWDIASDHVLHSTGFSKIFGYNACKAYSVKSFWFTKISEKDQQRVKTSLFAALENKNEKKWKDEYRFFKANGELAHVVDRGYIIRDKTGKAIRVVGAVLDVTESRRLIKEIKKQNRILKEIAWEQAHVVRAPLARIKGLLYLLDLEEFEDMDREEIMEHINTSTEELDDVVKGIILKTEEIGVYRTKTKSF